MNVRVIDGFCTGAEAKSAVTNWPDDSAPWVVYNTHNQTKRALNDWKHIPNVCRQLLGSMLRLNAPELLGCDPAIPDTLLWGAGLHEHKAGEKLDIHIDAAIHPLTGLGRKVNAILYLSAWQPEWGGDLQFWRNNQVSTTIYPAPGRLVLFEANDDSHHGMPNPIKCPPEVRRLSLATYWWGEPRTGAVRERSEFVNGHFGG